MGNILIVDDSSTMRKIISRSLRQAGLQVDDIYEAADGIEGLSVMEGKSIDLILSDINMPNMDGLEFVKCVRAKGIAVERIDSEKQFPGTRPPRRSDLAAEAPIDPATFPQVKWSKGRK